MLNADGTVQEGVLDLRDEVTGVVFDLSARCASQMERLVGVGQLPVARLVGAEVRLANEAEFGEQ